MKGSTVDAMALAVEGCEVMLIGVSRAYKESSNCRMEAQYGMQKKKPFIPLLVQEDYEADGWLGLLLGTSLWYALYGATLESESAFEDRMDALSRELGARGRADAAVPSVTIDEPEPFLDDAEAAEELRAELLGMRLMALQRRAAAEDVSDEAVEDAIAALEIAVLSCRSRLERGGAAHMASRSDAAASGGGCGSGGGGRWADGAGDGQGGVEGVGRVGDQGGEDCRAADEASEVSPTRKHATFISTRPLRSAEAPATSFQGRAD
eukprot:COSAG04_NODE_15_length_40535_cov_25.319888_22_plen_265_part_00